MTAPSIAIPKILGFKLGKMMNKNIDNSHPILWRSGEVLRGRETFNASWQLRFRFSSKFLSNIFNCTVTARLDGRYTNVCIMTT